MAFIANQQSAESTPFKYHCNKNQTRCKPFSRGLKAFYELHIAEAFPPFRGSYIGSTTIQPIFRPAKTPIFAGISALINSFIRGLFTVFIKYAESAFINSNRKGAHHATRSYCNTNQPF